VWERGGREGEGREGKGVTHFEQFFRLLRLLFLHLLDRLPQIAFAELCAQVSGVGRWGRGAGAGRGATYAEHHLGVHEACFCCFGHAG
jgi:hypothetical protein